MTKGKETHIDALKSLKDKKHISIDKRKRKYKRHISNDNEKKRKHKRHISIDKRKRT
jgi:hypothetical protein